MLCVAPVALTGIEMEAGAVVDTFVTDRVEVVVFKATVVALPYGAIDVVMGRPVVAALRSQASTEEEVMLTVTVLVVVEVIVVV